VLRGYWEHGDSRLDVLILARLPGDDVL